MVEDMAAVQTVELPSDYPQRIRRARKVRQLTQRQFADLVGVSFATVNRWENGHSRPTNLAWLRILALERATIKVARREESTISEDTSRRVPSLDFAGDPDAVSAVAEAHRLAYGHMFNSVFATETSRIDPLPHQRIAVYQRMLAQSPLRFLLADDAGAGKTIMTGLYAREMLSRRLIRRVLVVPPAGLVGNWERELRTLFQLRFRIASGQDARAGNPFVDPDSDLLIVSVDTLSGERMFNHLRDPETEPYDLVIFDEAHKLSADRQQDYRVRKTYRYRLAESIAGAGPGEGRWHLPWSARHLLLLTATPHMGKDFPYYYLWRLLLPDTLATHDAFTEFPPDMRESHFIRRTKEEMVHFDGRPLYPQRNCATLSYDLTQGPGGEQELYDETTRYMQDYYNRAKFLNRSAARLAMSVFQRRLASSTYALMRSLERRQDKLEAMIDDIISGRVSEESLISHQGRLNDIDDLFDSFTVDEYDVDGGDDQQEDFEDDVLGGVIAVSLAELEVERRKVEELLGKARNLIDRAEESKFDKLREVIGDPEYADEKLIVFTEHRDTALFLMRRLEGLGFTGQVASIHGGMTYQEREQQVEFFRRPASDNGANYLIATDAAGEGINLQFCWLMVNYDIPWNPARLEQRMGRIHRYGQAHDPVIIINFVASETREGRVMKTLLDKLETIRQELQSDKVFDVLGRLLEDVSMRDYLEDTMAGVDTDLVQRIDETFTSSNVLSLGEKERSLYGRGGDVEHALPELREQIELEDYRRLIPGYVRGFIEKSTPLLDLRIEGDPGDTFTLSPTRPGALDPMLAAFEMYPESTRDRLTLYRSKGREDAIWLHPSEPVFDAFAGALVRRFAGEARRGSIFIDPQEEEPYLLHIALVSVEQAPVPQVAGVVEVEAENSVPIPLGTQLIGLRQWANGTVEEYPVERLLLLLGTTSIAPGSVPLAARSRELVADVRDFARTEKVGEIVTNERERILADLPTRLEFVKRGYAFQEAELVERRAQLSSLARSGDVQAGSELVTVRIRQQELIAERERRIAELESEPDRVESSGIDFVVHVLVLPSSESEDIEHFDVQVEKIAMEVAVLAEEESGATVQDVSTPAMARRAGLLDWPGFDLISTRPDGERRGIEVKGRAEYGSINISPNEWRRACSQGDNYWLYVVYNCATPYPKLMRVQDPFAKLIASSSFFKAFTVNFGAIRDAAE